MAAPGTVLSIEPSTAGTLMPQRPQMPTEEDERRAAHQSTRSSILLEDWEDVVLEWLKQHVDEENLAAWGPPDLSANPLADLSRQLSTPGLYGIRPDYRHPDATAAGLIGPEGALQAAGWTTKMQRVQYLVLGMGDYFLRLDVPHGSRELSIRLVAPHDVYVEVDDDIPDRPVKLWELRRRWWEAEQRWVYCWDQFDLGESRPGRTPRDPSWRVVLCKRPNLLDDGDVSNIFLGKPGGYRGAEYPYRDASGKPVLPYVKYSSIDSGRLWNHLDKRGAARGTLNAALYWTYAGHAAKSASGRAVIVAGLEPIGEVQEAPAGVAETRRVRTVRIMPGSIAYHAFSGDAGQAMVTEIGPGAEVEKLREFADHYEMKQAVRWGLDPTDITRQSANPSSGAALLISARGKRNFSRQVEEVFRRSDMEVIRLAAILLRVAGVATYPESGYSVTYHEIPDSPAEQADKREQADWEIGKDFLSPEQAYVRWHPGVSEENASAAIIESGIAKLRIEAALKKQAEAEGLMQSAEKKEVSGVIAAETRATVADVTEGKYTPAQGRAILEDLFGMTAEQALRWIPADVPDRTPGAKGAPVAGGGAAPGAEPVAQGGQGGEDGGAPEGPQGEQEGDGEEPVEKEQA